MFKESEKWNDLIIYFNSKLLLLKLLVKFHYLLIVALKVLIIQR